MAFVPSLAWYLWLALHNPRYGIFSDDIVYLLMADIYSPWHDSLTAVHQHLRHFAQFPPLFPMLLGALGAGSAHPVIARAVVAASFALAAYLQAVWLRRQGVPQWTALGFALLTAWLPAMWIMVVDVWSEGVYLCLVWLALLLVQAARRQGAAWWLAGLAGLAVACAMATRSVGLALAPALVMAFIPHRPGRALLAVGVFALAQAGFHGLAIGGSQSYDEILAGTYGNGFLGALGAQLAKSGAALGPAFLYDFFLWRSLEPWQCGVALALALVLLIGWGHRLRQLEASALYALGYLCIILVWPFEAEMIRFVIPLVPFALYFLWSALRSRGQQEISGLVLAVLIAALAAPSAWRCMTRAWTPVPVAALDSWRYTRHWLDATRVGDPIQFIDTLDGYERAARGIAALVPVSECLYSPQVQLMLWHAQRIAYLPPSPETLQSGKPLACRYIHAIGDVSRKHPAFYPLDVLPGLKAIGAWNASGEDVMDGRGRAAALLLRLP